MPRAGLLNEPPVVTSLRTRWHSGGLGPLAGAWRLSMAAGQTLPRDPQGWSLFRRGPHSRLYTLDDGSNRLVKAMQPRSQPRDGLRKYANAQGRREYDSACRLQQIGLATPAVYGWGLSAMPWAATESLLVMQHIAPWRSALSLIRESHDSVERHRLYDEITSQLACLHGHGLIHKDGHFDNLGLDADSTLLWIDNDIRVARNSRTLRYGFSRTLALLRRTARSAMTADEWHYFNDRLRQALASWPLARTLVDEV